MASASRRPSGGNPAAPVTLIGHASAMQPYPSYVLYVLYVLFVLFTYVLRDFPPTISRPVRFSLNVVGLCGAW